MGSKVGGKEWMELLKTAISGFHEISSNPVFILIDAYDEFLHKGNKQQRERGRFREYIKEINETGKASIVITTRDYLADELHDGFDSYIIKMQADGEDIDKFLDNEIDPLFLSLKNKVCIKDTIKGENAREKWLPATF